MKQPRLYYLFYLLGTIGLGLLSRSIKGIPMFMGDLLYAIMIYFVMHFLFPKAKARTIALVSLLVCYVIETLQLYQADWIVNIRSTTIGHLILGQGFLWSDIAAYTFGIGIIFIIENLLQKPADHLQKS